MSCLPCMLLCFAVLPPAEGLPDAISCFGSTEVPSACLHLTVWSLGVTAELSRASMLLASSPDKSSNSASSISDSASTSLGLCLPLLPSV